VSTEAYIGGSDYWANNIRREFKATNPDQIAFCDNFKNLIKELMVSVSLELISSNILIF
jgi:hypothetical protein